MITKKIAIIGLGHMGKTLIAGFSRGKIIKKKNLILSNGPDNIEAAKRAEIIIISVKPKIVKVVAEEIINYLTNKSIIISAAACINIDILEKYFGKEKKIVRIMPNLPVEFGMGVVGWVGNKNISFQDEQLLLQLLETLGLVIKCSNEKFLDKLSVLSGSGPGYIGFILHSLELNFNEAGFKKSETTKIIQQLILGIVKQLSLTGMNSMDLVKKVSTKGGITEEIIQNMESNNLHKLLFNSFQKGYDKIEKIKKELKYGDL